MKRITRAILYLFLLFLFGQVIRAVPVEADPQISLGLDVTVPVGPIAMGEEKIITLDLRNDASGPLTNVKLQLPHHQNVLYVAGPGIPTEGVSSAKIPIGDLAGNTIYQVQVTVQVRGFTRSGNLKLPFKATATEADAVTEEANLIFLSPIPEVRPVPVGSGQVDAANGRVTIDFPGGWYTNTAVISFELTTQRQLVGKEKGNILGFEVEALDNGRPVNDFSRPLTVTLQISDLVDLTRFPEEDLYLFTREDPTDEWEEVPLTLDEPAGTVHFQATHFSEYEMGAGYPQAWQLGYTPPTASAFSGSASYSYPMNVPPGIGGLTPQLGVSYSSRGVDSQEYPVMGRGFGAGWSMPTIEIINGNTTNYYDNDPESYGPECGTGFFEEEFTLILNGQTYRLEPATSADRHGIYYASGNPNLHLEYIDDTNAPNVTGEYWQLITADGIIYRLGYNSDSEQTVVVQDHANGCNSNDGQPRDGDIYSAFSWKVDTITDIYGRMIEYSYKNKCSTDDEQVCYDYRSGESGDQFSEIDVAIDEIKYNFVNSQPQTVISFTHTYQNHSAEEEQTYMSVGYYRPDRILIEHNSEVVSAYEFTYETEEHKVAIGDPYAFGFWWIKDVTAYGSDYNPATSSGTALSTQTFTYEEEVSDSCGVNMSEVNKCVYLLTKVDNGYGAITKITYETIVKNYGLYSSTWYLASDINTWDGLQKIYGVDFQSYSTTKYDRDSAVACYDIDGDGCRSPSEHQSNGLVGFDSVIVTQKSSGSTVSRQEMEFDISDHWLSGRTTAITTTHATITSTILSVTTYTWALDEDERYARVTRQDDYQYDPENQNDIIHAYQVLTYDDVDPTANPPEFGALIKKEDYDDGGTLYRCTQYAYSHEVNLANDLRLVNHLKRQTAYTGACGSGKIAETLYRYTGSEDPFDYDLGGKAELAWVLTWAGTWDDKNHYVTQQTHYYSNSQADNYGLVEKVETFNDYSWAYTDLSNGDYATDVRSTVRTPAYTDIGLPSSVETFGGDVITQTQTISYTADMPWLPQVITNTNSISQTFDFDIYGRLITATHKATDGTPVTDLTISYTIIDPPGSASKALQINQVAFPDETNKITTSSFYNGLGGLIQQRSYYNEGSGNVVNWTHTEYDGLGRPTCQTVPQDGSGATGYDDTVTCSSEPNTTTVYDSLGRVIKTTAPGGDNSYIRYSIDDSNDLFWTDSYNANRQNRREAYDQFGRLVQVKEMTGNCQNGLPTFYQTLACSGSYTTAWSDYATTDYTYNILGNLTQVTDEDDNSTIMTYDSLGRKISMNDPDMGSWKYIYDINGNLIRQVHNAPVKTVLCFYYDDFNRLVRKVKDDTPNNSCPLAENAPTSGLEHLASYVYDTATNGVGLPAQVSWGPDPDINKETFTYDSKGRLDEHTRWIDGVSYTMEVISYDNCGRPSKVEYPDGKQVEMKYDAEGENELIFDPSGSNDSLVENVVYNRRGQMTSLERGNGVDTTYTYSGATGINGNNNFRLETIQHGTTGDNIPDFDFEYDPIGNITKIQTLASTGNDTQDFTYDHLNRLVTAEGSLSPYDYDYAYTYDEIGNIKTRTDVDTSQTITITYNYDGLKPHAVESLSGAVTADYDYDDDSDVRTDNGNMIYRSDSSGIFDQSFDVENRLYEVRETTSGDITTFAYDANGIRVQTTKPDGTYIHTPFPNYEVEYQPDAWIPVNGASDLSFEDNEWTFTTTTGYQGTAISSTAPYVGSAYTGTQVLAISNLASATAVSKQIGGGNGFEANKTYRVDGSVKGYLLPDISAGKAEIWFNFKNTAGTLVTETLAWSNGDLQSTNWTAITTTDQITVTAPSWATKLRVIIKIDKVNGWIAFDSIEVSEENTGSWTAIDWSHGDFEDSANWTLATDSEFPASSVWFGDGGPVSAESDRYSLVMTNQGYSQSTSSLFNTGSQSLDHTANAWLRGFTSSVGGSGAYLVGHYYDSSDNWLGQETIWDSSGNQGPQSLATVYYQLTNWRPITGEMSLPSGTTQMKLQVVNAFGEGRLDYDDMSAEYIDGGTPTSLTVPDPGFETGGVWTDWLNSTATTTTVASLATLPHSGDEQKNLSNNHLAYGFAESQSVSITGGNTYRFRIHAKQAIYASGNNISFRMAFYKSDGSLSQRVTTSRWTSTPTPVWVSFDGWLRYEGIAIAPSDAVSVKLEVSANQLNGYAFFDNVKVDEFDPGDTIYRSTYGLAGQPIATRIVTSPSDPNDGIYYIHTDHLGSVSAMSDGSSGALVGDIIRFDPFGDYRPGSGAGDITDRGFTGHKHNDYIGLVYMVGRYYIQSIGRFASPDSIIPQTFNPQSLNRYSYVQNSPLNRIDPTGHEDICDDPLQCNEPPPSPPPIPTGPLVTFSVEEGCTSTITAVCNWSQAEMDAITQAALDTGVRLAETINAANPGWNLSPEEAFMLVYGGSINFRKTDDTSASGAWGETFLRGGRHEIDVYTDAYYDDGSSGLVDSRWAVHEFGHAFINVVGRSPLLFLDIIQGYDDNFPDRPLTPNARDGTWGFAGPRWGWQRSDQGRTSEEFADMFLGWVYNTWELGDAGGFSDDGQARADFMNYFMPYWTGWAID